MPPTPLACLPACLPACSLKLYYWQSILQLESLALVCVQVFGMSLTLLYQALLLQVRQARPRGPKALNPEP